MKFYWTIKFFCSNFIGQVKKWINIKISNPAQNLSEGWDCGLSHFCLSQRRGMALASPILSLSQYSNKVNVMCVSIVAPFNLSHFFNIGTGRSCHHWPTCENYWQVWRRIVRTNGLNELNISGLKEGRRYNGPIFFFF